MLENSSGQKEVEQQNIQTAQLDCRSGSNSVNEQQVKILTRFRCFLRQGSRSLDFFLTE